MLQIEPPHHRTNSEKSFFGAVTFGGLSAFAKRHNVSFAISGSIAQKLFSLSQTDQNTDVCSVIGPLSDIDLIVREPNHQTSLVATLQNTFPILRFFHLETRVKRNPNDHPYRRLGNIRIEQAPEIWFGTEDNAESGGNVYNFSEGSGETLPKETISVGWIERKLEDPESEAFAALLDLLFLLKHQLTADENNEIVDKLVEKITAKEIDDLPDDFLEQYFALKFDRQRRLKFALLKFLCSRQAVEHSAEAVDDRFKLNVLLPNLLGKFQNQGVLKTLIRLALAEKPEPFRAMIVPKRSSQRWIRDVRSVQIDQDNEIDLLELLMPKQDQELLDLMVKGGCLSPIFKMRTEDPPDPHCCDYHDFSRGHAEAVWVDPSENNTSTSQIDTEMQQFMTPIVSTTFKELAFTHSYQYWGAVSSVRMDFGHVCALVGHSQPVFFRAIGNSPKRLTSDGN